MGDSERTVESQPAGPVNPGAQTGKENPFMPLLVWLVAGVIIGYVAYVVVFPPAQAVAPPQNNTPPAPVPPAFPKVSIILINDSRCVNCNSAGSLMASIAQAASTLNISVVNTTVIDAASPQGQALVSQYSIGKVPALLLSKEASASQAFDSAWATIGTKAPDGTFIFQEPAPYYDLAAGRMVGLVEAVEIQPTVSCEKCYNVSNILSALSGPQVGMVFSRITVLSANSSDGSAMVSRYNITRLPAIVLSPDAGAYTQMAQVWGQVGDVAADGSYIYRGGFPPYFDMENGSIVGLVSLIELIDPTCANCSNVSAISESLSQSGVEFSNTTAYLTNSTDGRKLLAKYNITVVPTVIMSSDILAYTGFEAFWAKAGTIEKDGWLVMRYPETFGFTYKNLTSGNVTVGTAG